MSGAWWLRRHLSQAVQDATAAEVGEGYPEGGAPHVGHRVEVSGTWEATVIAVSPSVGMAMVQGERGVSRVPFSEMRRIR